MQLKTYHASEHDIDSRLVDPDACQVIKKLREAGYSAYLVGGGVRDLLIKKIPKDYDISTSARPEQIKQLFHKNCLLIGRRFRLAHIRFGRKVFEVSTFRAGENADDLILQDNVWGSEEEDVARRDFTINGLFYDPASHTVLDYVGGWNDIHQGVLRTIGEPEVRFRQDPVRMLRLLKFRARFGFNIEPEARKALIKCRNEILKSSPARILEELFRMLESGASAPFFNLMNESGMLELLLPSLAKELKGDNGKQIYLLLASADKLQKKKARSPLDRGVLLACLLYPLLEREANSHFDKNGSPPHLGEITMMAAAVVKTFVTMSFTHFPRRISTTATFILANQFRLTPLAGRKHHRGKIIHHKEFELAVIFLKLRAQIDARLNEHYSSWVTTLKGKRPSQ
ncbi:MAG: polynucleotide adenylyltransferase PcnB [Parachlamydiaceae bacterium]